METYSTFVNPFKREQTRKALAQIISSVSGDLVVYAGPPTYEYRIGPVVIDRDHVIWWPTGFDCDIIDAVIKLLRRKGWSVQHRPVKQPKAAGTVYSPVTVKTKDVDAVLAKVEALIASKKSLLCQGLDLEEIKVEATEQVLVFNWVKEGAEPGFFEAVTILCQKLVELAENVSRVSSKEKPTDNPRFAMRTFLIRLGMIGPDYKQARKHLMGSLPGSAAWRNGTPAKGGQEK